MALVDELTEVLGADAVVADPQELSVYACDGFPIARGVPAAVVFPTETEQVAEVMRVLGRHGVEVVPRGSGTGLAGGAVAFDGGVLVSTSRMTRVESVDIANRVACVQAGVRNTALTEAVQATPGGGGEDYHFSPDPSSQRASTIGGNAATNAGGINTLKHGVTSNHVLGLEVVLASGEVVVTGGIGGERWREESGEWADTTINGRSPSRDLSTLHAPRSTIPSALADLPGPDLTGLFCGSEGTLGVITRVWCRLTPRPRHFRTVYAVFDSTFDCCQTVSDVIASGIVPTSMEVMDGAMINVVEDAFHYGFPTTAQALLLIEIDGIDAVLDRQMQQVGEIARANHAGDVQSCSDPARRAELWSARKRAFGAIGRISHSYCTQDACIPRSKLPEAMDHIARLGEEHGLKITNVFHAGDGNIHPIMLFDEDDPDDVQRVLRLSEEVLRYCISIGGALTGEHGVGVEKLHLMRDMFDETTLDTFGRIKEALDPDRRINDGKLIPSPKIDIRLVRPVAAGVPGGAL